MKVKGLANSLGSIGVFVYDEDLLSVTLNGLGREYAQFRTSIGVCETFHDFKELAALRGVIADIEIWPKHIGHVSIQRLKSMQMQSVVAGVFKVNGMQKVCEACQMGK